MKTERLSFSALKAFAQSPNHYLLYKSDKPDSAAMAFGRAFHVYTLQPELFSQLVAVAPDVDKRTKLGKEEYAQFEATAEGKEVITIGQYMTMQRMATAIYGHPIARQLMENTQREIREEKPIYGVQFAGIADVLERGRIYAVDLKTAKNSSPEDFQKTAYNSDYHLQAAIYRHLFGVVNFYWIVVESDKPHNVSVFEQDTTAATRADARLRELIERWNEWDGSPQPYTTELVNLTLPKWA